MKYTFRTHEEMSQIYEELKKEGRDQKPYVLDYSQADPALVFFGTTHSNDSNNGQYPEIDELWRAFVSRPGKKVAFSEGGLRDVKGMTREEAILRFADPGYICWLAQEAGIEIASPEPSRRTEVKDLIKTFGPEKTILYYFARQMLQWARGDFMTQPNVEEYIDNLVERYTPDRLEGFKITREGLYDIFEQETGKKFAFTEIHTMYKISDPGQDPVPSRSSTLRNESIFNAIVARREAGTSVFAVFGSGHAIVLEPAIAELLK